MDAFKPGNLIVCNGSNCDFKSIIQLIRVLINDLTVLATLLTVVALIFIGFKLMTSGGNVSAMSEAKSRATKLVIGYIIILSAWLVVHTITSTLLNPDFSIV